MGGDVRVQRAEDDVWWQAHREGDDPIFVFASENEGGPGLIASGVVGSAKTIAKKRGVARQTPRVSITIRRTALAKRRLGRSELKLFTDWNDGRPETELNFDDLAARGPASGHPGRGALALSAPRRHKFYRQATNEIVGISQHLGQGGTLLLRRQPVDHVVKKLVHHPLEFTRRTTSALSSKETAEERRRFI